MRRLRNAIGVCLLAAGAAQAEMLAGYDFDAGAPDASAATVVASNMTAGRLTSPMDIEFVTTVGDDTGVDAAGGAFGSTDALGCVGIGVDDAATSSFSNAVAANDYVAFTITPDVGFELRLDSLAFKATKKATTSVDEYAVTDASGNLIGSPVVITNVVGLTGAYDGVVVDLSGTVLEKIWRATEIRIYVWGRGTDQTSGTLAALDKITLHGNNTAVVVGGDFYVATTGNDTSAGTLAEPFATIQHAVDRSGPGSTVYIREGAYREVVDLAGVAGAPGFPITLTAYPNETVTLDGTAAITNRWTLDAGNVYKTTVGGDVTQLFVDGKPMTLARYPDAPVFSDICWNGGRLSQDAGSSNGTVIDDALAETGISYNDCVAIMTFGNHATGARLVENHVAGSNTFNYASLDKYKTQDLYFFEGGLNNAERVLLDTPEEWAYDESTRTLYLWADDGRDPEGRQIFGKGTNAYAVVGDADTHDIVIDGIDFFAATFYLESSDQITIQNCDFDYYAASHRSLGDIEPPPTAFIDGSESNLCVDITIFNCAFRYADGGGLWVDNAENPRIENNLFQQIDYACVDPCDIGDAEIFNLTKGTIPIRQSRDIVFRRNTVERAGSAQGVTISLYDSNEG
ncbi:hypothetical protein, partial [Pontiella sp.]|uniref:hypothetical protein n=1 Tax=Pontiella sp. TaxID=2837462 RepID=UPI0035648C07